MAFIQAYDIMSHENIKAWAEEKIAADSYAVRFMLHAAAELLERPWFRRCWVVQEFVLCKEREPYFQCGQYLVSSKAFPQFSLDAHFSSPKLLQLYTKGAAYYDPRILAGPCAQGLVMWSAHSRFETRSKTSTMDWLLLYNDLEATNARDKLYSSLGLQKWGGERETPEENVVSNGLIIDYDASVEDVYSSAVRHQVKSTHKLDILLSCGPRSDLVTRSWVPDWTVSSISEAHKVLEFDYKPETSKKTQCIVKFANDLSFMVVRGFVWDTIRLVENHWPSQIGDSPYYTARQEFCRAAWSYEEFGEWHKSDQKAADTLWRAMLHPYYLADETPEKSTALIASLLAPRSTWQKDLRSLLDKGKRFGGVCFQTLRGQVGNAFRGNKEFQPYLAEDARVQIGDLVCVLLGCPVPMVLRKQKSHYEVVVPVFEEGVMRGEAMDRIDDGSITLQDFELH